jgi:hypothetical protein
VQLEASQEGQSSVEFVRESSSMPGLCKKGIVSGILCLDPRPSRTCVHLTSFLKLLNLC